MDDWDGRTAIIDGDEGGLINRDGRLGVASEGGRGVGLAALKSNALTLNGARVDTKERRTGGGPAPRADPGGRMSPRVERGKTDIRGFGNGCVRGI